MSVDAASIVRAFLKWIRENKKWSEDSRPRLHWDTMFYPCEIKEEDIEKWIEEFQTLLSKGLIEVVVG